ncbi:MAG TPA: metallopeptidase TldD-related protein [Anaerolineae bacterium]
MNVIRYGNAQVELLHRSLDVTRVGCKFSRVRSIERQHYLGRAARAIVNGKLGHASSTDSLTDDRLVQRAIAVAQVDVPSTLTFPEATLAVDAVNATLAGMPDSDLCALAEDILHGIGQGRPEIAIELEVRRMGETIQLHNSRGGQYALSRAWLEGEAWIERHSGSDVLVVQDTFASARVDAHGGHREFARRMARRLRWAKREVRPKPGAQSVILSPGAFSSLLRPMLLRLNGAQAFQDGSRGSKRQSGLAWKVGNPIFDPRFSLYDDATLADRPRSAPVDHEGTPGQRTALIERGTLKGFYYDLHSAALAETRSTGNGWRVLMEPPHPTPTNVVIGTGDTSLTEMVKRLKDGLLIDMVMSSDSAASLQGDFARTVVMAYPIKNGRIAGFVKGIGIGGNLYRALQSIEALSCDGYWAGDIFAPYLQIGGVTVTV